MNFNINEIGKNAFFSKRRKEEITHSLFDGTCNLPEFINLSCILEEKKMIPWL